MNWNTGIIAGLVVAVLALIGASYAIGSNLGEQKLLAEDARPTMMDENQVGMNGTMSPDMADMAQMGDQMKGMSQMMADQMKLCQQMMEMMQMMSEPMPMPNDHEQQ